MNITIVGGGNIGTQFAVHCAEKGHDVTVYTSTPELFDGHLSIVDETGTVIHEGDIRKATADPQEAFCDAKLIIVTVPANLMKPVAELVLAHADSSAIIGVVPGNGGSECAFRKCIERGNVFFGMERVPAIARLVIKGRSVRSTGYRDELHVAAIPAKHAPEYAKLIEAVFDKKTEVVPNFLNLTMTPSNPVIHTTRLRTIFKDWKEGVSYDHLPLFYEEWDNASSELLIACDEEVQNICRALPGFKLQFVRSLRTYYDSPTAQDMTGKISSIRAFKGLKTPAIERCGAYIPDLHSRYFTADFSFGLAIIKQIADFAKVSTPYIDDILNWYKKIALEKDEFRFEDYGIVSRDDFDSFYMQ